MYKSELQNYDQLIDENERLAVVCVSLRTDNAHFLVQSGNKITLYETKEKDGKFQPIIVKDFPVFPEITGTIHSATAYEIGKHIFVFDEKNMYVISYMPYKIVVYPNIYCIGIQNFTKSYNYALC